MLMAFDLPPAPPPTEGNTMTNQGRDAHHEPSIWSRLAAPLDPATISWRQDSAPKAARSGNGFFARYVAYIEATTVRERLDEVVPGEWDLTLEVLPSIDATLSADANMGPCNFKARMQVLGVVREDVGTGKDYKQASTDAFKRVAVRFGIGAELYAYEQNYVPMDSDAKWAKPLEDPAVVYARKRAQPQPADFRVRAMATTQPPRQAPRPAAPVSNSEAGAQVSTPEQPPHPSEGNVTQEDAGRAEMVRMPFGRDKGTALGELDMSSLESTITWVMKNNPVRYAQLAKDCRTVLNNRYDRDRPEGDDIPF